MAQEAPVFDYTFTAASDLSAKQFTFVKLSAANTVDSTTAITDVPVGVLQNKPTANQAATVRVLGLTKLVASGSISAAAAIGPEAANTARAASITIPASTAYVAGVAVTAASQAADVFTALIDCIQPNRAT
jgi:hypothetical protein